MKQNFIAQKSISLYLIFLAFFIYIIDSTATKTFAQSEVYLSIKAGGSDYIGVGIGGFEAYVDTSGTVSNEPSVIVSVKDTVIDDLNNCGLFEVKTLSDSLEALPGGIFAQWRAAGAQYFFFGQEKNNGNSVSVSIIDLKTAVTLLNEEYIIDRNRPWYTAHIFVDDTIELFTGLRGSMASQITYFHPYKEENSELYIIDADGGRRRQLTFSKTLNISPSWSPDGKYIAFSSLLEKKWSIVMINVNTGQTQDISPWSGLSATPAWSPVNPDIVAFSSTRDGNSELYSCRTDGKNIRRLTNHSRIDSSPSWSPDGEQIVFISDRSGQPTLYLMNRDGSNVHRLTKTMNAYEDSPCWSPRGDRIAFVILFDRGFDIATVSPTGDDLVILTSGQGSNENPRWSPDGLRIVFSSTRLGGKNLFIMNRDGYNVRPLTKDSSSFSPAWAPASSGNDIRVSSRR